MDSHWETLGWRKETSTKLTSFVKNNKVLWDTGRFNSALHPAEPSEWIEQWTVAEIIENRYCKHRIYNSLEEALQGEEE